MMKKVLSVLLVVALLFSLSTSAFALSTYTVPAGTAVLEQVPMDYEVLVIPGDVLVISDASENYSQYPLRYVSIGEGVQYIGSYSFSGSAIETVTIPNSVTYIGRNAFPTVTKVILKCGAAKAIFGENSTTLLAEAFPMATTLVVDANYADFTDYELICFDEFLSTKPEATIVFNDKTIVSNNYLADGSIEIPGSAYQGSLYESVILPDSMRIIGNMAFYGSTISYIDLAKTESIYSQAFYDCHNLTSVKIPATVKSIGENAFNTVQTVTFESGNSFEEIFYGECSSAAFSLAFPEVSTVYINTDVYSVELYRVTENPAVQTIIFGDGYVWQRGVFSIPEGTTGIWDVDDCPESVILPDSVRAIWSSAFADTNLRYIDLAKTEGINDNAFCNCDLLTSVEIPSTVTFIGENAFNTVQTVTFEVGSAEYLFGDEDESFNFASSFPNAHTVYINTIPERINIGEVTVSETVNNIIFADGSVWQRGELFFPKGSAVIADGAYQNWALDSINIPENITAIGANAFSGVTSENGTALILGENVTEIKPGAFESSAVSSIIFGGAHVSIGENAFANTALTSVKIPANVVNLGANAFATDSLKSVVIDASVITSGALDGKSLADVFGTVENIIIEGNLTEIPQSIFYGTNATSISYSDKVISIGANAFRNCEIKEPNIGENVLNIGERAYRYSAITALNIPDNVINVGKEAFSACKSLGFVTVGKGVSEISEGMFSNCTILKTAVLPSSVTKIGDYAFSGCVLLSNVNIPSGVKEIGISAFEGCESIKSVVIPDGVTTIKAGAFKNCTGLEKVVIPGSVTVIEDGAFEGCTALDGVTIPANIEEIQAAAFKNCVMLDTVVVPETVTTLGENAFEGCTNLTLAGCSGSAVATYASGNNVTFYEVNAYPVEGTQFDFENNIIYTGSRVCDDIENIVKSSQSAEIIYSDKFCGTGSTVTVVKGTEKQTYTLVVDGDINGDGACDVLDASLATSYASAKATPSLAQIYAAGGKDAEAITVAEYSLLVNKAVSE